MSIDGIGAIRWYRWYPAKVHEAELAERKITGDGCAERMCGTISTAQNISSTFELHISNDVDGKAVSAGCGSDYSLTVYEPKGFDPANPVYKVKMWDGEGNVTERMVDLSAVDPGNSDYVDMFAYSSYLTDTGKCPNAQSVFVGADAIQHGSDGQTYDGLFSGKNWLDVVKYAMQMQYDAGNLEGYLADKKFLDFLEA